MNCNYKKSSCLRKQWSCTNRSDTFLYDQSFRSQRWARLSFPLGNLPIEESLFFHGKRILCRVIARPRMKGGALLRHIFQPFLVSVFSASLATMLAISVMYHSG